MLLRLATLLCFSISSLLAASARADLDQNASPFALLQSVFGENWGSRELSEFARDPQNVVNVLDYLRAHVASTDGAGEYDRSTDFGGWAYPDPASCQNTRARVLLRDADPAKEIKYTNQKECSVLTGLWHDPYTGKDFVKARDLDIDHVVPLHTAWMSGAYAWDSARRCHYANYMSNAIHLLPVSSQQNRAKGDRGPDGYMPPDDHGACRYLGSWMRIKAIWELTATQNELAGIEQLFKDHRCRPEQALVPASELLQQRQTSQTPIPACAEFLSTGHLPRPEY